MYLTEFLIKSLGYSILYIYITVSYYLILYLLFII